MRGIHTVGRRLGGFRAGDCRLLFAWRQRQRLIFLCDCFMLCRGLQKSGCAQAGNDGIEKSNGIVQGRHRYAHERPLAEDTPAVFGDILNLNGLPMGIGTWSWGDKSMWGYGGYDKELSEATAEAAFKKSLQCGIKLIDTAAMYGKGESERLVGQFLKRLTPEERSDLVVATKYCPMPWHLNARCSLVTSLKESLERLQMEKVDLFQIHGPAFSVRSIEHLAHGLADAYDAGLTKAVGVSNFNKDQVRRAHGILAKRNVPLTSNQVEFSLLRMRALSDGLFATCSELGVKILAYSPLGMGRLTGKYTVDNPPPSNRRFGNVPIEEMQPLIDKMNSIAASRDKTVSQVALNWIICKGAIPIPGAKNEKQAEQNAGALGWSLKVEEIEELDKLGFQGTTNMIWQHG